MYLLGFLIFLVGVIYSGNKWLNPNLKGSITI